MNGSVTKWKEAPQSYHHAKFGGHVHSGRGDIKFLVCCVIFQDHMINDHVTLWVGDA